MFKHAWILQNRSSWTKYWENKKEIEKKDGSADKILTFISLIFHLFVIQSSTEDTVYTTNPHFIYQHGYDLYLFSQSLWLICHGILIASSREKSSGRSDSWSLYKIRGLWPEIFSSLHLPDTHGFEQFSRVHSQHQFPYNLFSEEILIIFFTLFISLSGNGFEVWLIMS